VPEASATPTSEVPPSASPEKQKLVTIHLPDTDFSAGEIFSCRVEVINHEGHVISGYPLFVILEIDGSLFFAPEFSESDYFEKTYVEGSSFVEAVPAFTWPESAGAYEGAWFYAALTNPGITELASNLEQITFGWN
jgi:hypothetical protein